MYKIIKKTNNYDLKYNHKNQNISKFNEYINNFINFINSNQNIDLKLFYENLKNLVIKKKTLFNKFFFIKYNIRGYYDGLKNKIVIIKEDNFYSIYHELLHCASRKIIGNEINIGFHKFIIDNKSNKIIFNMGKSLNEGYTALLEKRYFSNIKHNQKSGYIIEEFIASMIEKIIGKDHMEKLYFNADLCGLINYLKEFASYNDIILFLMYFNKISITSNVKTNPKEIEYIYKFIGAFLLKTYTYKLGRSFENNEIKYDKFKVLMNDFINELMTNSTLYNKNTYYFLTKKFACEILNQINENLDIKQKIRLM